MGAERVGGVDVDGMPGVEIDHLAMLQSSLGHIPMWLEATLEPAIQQQHPVPDLMQPVPVWQLLGRDAVGPGDGIG